MDTKFKIVENTNNLKKIRVLGGVMYVEYSNGEFAVVDKETKEYEYLVTVIEQIFGDYSYYERKSMDGNDEEFEEYLKIAKHQSDEAFFKWLNKK